MNIESIDSRKLTTIAFLIGLAITDNLTSTEQAAVGNLNNSIIKEILKKTSNIINRELNKL